MITRQQSQTSETPQQFYSTQDKLTEIARGQNEDFEELAVKTNDLNVLDIE